MSHVGMGPVLRAAMEARRRGQGAVVALVVASRMPDAAQPGSRLLVADDVEGQIGMDPGLERIVREDACQSLAERRSKMRSYTMQDGLVQRARPGSGDVDIFYEVLASPQRLVIVGAGHIAVPLARFGALLGFDVLILDDRAEYANAGRFPDATEILVGEYRDVLGQIEVDRDTCVVLVTRGHVHDQTCLEYLLQCDPGYVGMIGSKRRVRTVLERLKASGYDSEILDRIYAPVGLDIGSQTPAEIALSIMAEIVRVSRGGTGISLSLQAGRHA